MKNFVIISHLLAYIANFAHCILIIQISHYMLNKYKLINVIG